MTPTARRLSFAIFLAATAVAVGWLAWPAEYTAAPLTEPGSSRASTADAASAGGDLALRDGEPLRTAGSATPLSGTPQPELVVLVVDDSDRPLPGAEVGVYVARDADDHVHSELREQQAWAGEVRIADARAEVRIPIGDPMSWTIYGRREGLWGVVFVENADLGEVRTLRLQRDLTVRARVVDPRGRSVFDARVAFGDDAAVETFAMYAFRATTEPEGIATFLHAQQMVRPDWGTTAAVMLGTPIGKAIYTRVDLDAPQAEPYVLELPDTGAMRIVLVDADGQTIDGLTETVYARLYELTQAGERMFWLPFDGAQLSVRHVGLGLGFRLELSSPEVDGTIEFDGPRTFGEIVERRLVVERHPTMSGRLVDEQGTPQQGYWWAVHMQPGHGFYRQYFETGSDGLFHTAIPTLEWSTATDRSVLFRRTLPDLELHAWFDLADLGLHDGRNELGDIVLRPAPTLVFGRVVDDSGAPVAGAVLTVWQGDPSGETWRVAGIDDAEFTSDENGEFRVRGHHHGGDLLLSVELDGNRGEMMPFVAGTGPHTCVLPRVGTVEMPVTFVGDLTAEAVLFCSENERTGITRSLVSHYAYEAGTARWRGLRPGRYTFSIRTLGSPDPLVTVGDVEVVGGRTVALPPRELGRDLTSIHVRVVDLEGGPIERASVVVDPEQHADRPRAALQTKLGELTLLSPRTPVDLLVIAPGFRTRAMRGVTGDLTVRLDAGLRVELEVTLPEGFPAADQQLVPRVRTFDPADPDPEPWNAGHDLWLRGAGSTWYRSHHPWLWDQRQVLGRDGRLVLRVPAPGEYAIEWDLRGAGERELPKATRRTFTVNEVDGTTRVAVRLSAEEVR